MSSPQKVVCAYCHAPLAAELGVVICTYCGKPNNPSGLPGKTAVKEIVHEVVQQDANANGVPDVLEQHARPKMLLAVAAPAATSKMYTRALAGTVGMSLVLLMFVPIIQAAMESARAPAPPETARRLGLAAPAVAATPWGDPTLMQVIGDSVYIAAAPRGLSGRDGETQIHRAARGTLEPKWSILVNGARHRQYFLQHEDRLILSTTEAVLLLDAATGAQVARYSLLNDSGTYGACIVENHVLFDIPSTQRHLRLDLTTGQKVEGTGICRPVQFHPPTPEGQEARYGNKTYGDFHCKYFVKTSDGQYAACKVDDGTNQFAVVAVSPKGQVRWSQTLGKEHDDIDSIVRAGNLVLVVSDDVLFAYNDADGAPRWQQAIDAGVNGAYAFDDDYVYITNASGHVAALSLTTGQQVVAR